MHFWKFFRTGGLTQVTLKTADDLLNLRKLDKKLWVALSCPVKGLEIDEKTLALIDQDGDARVRVPEVLAAVEWAAERLKDPGELLLGADSLPLDSIDDSTPAGEILVASAKQILASLGKEGADSISPEESSNTAEIFSSSPLNGDGTIPSRASDDPVIQGLIQDIIGTQGGTVGRCGNEGVTADQIETFFSELHEYLKWVEESADREIAVLQENTDAAVTALKAVREKVDDFFARCRLAAFDDRATSALNRSESAYLEVAAKDLKITVEEVAEFPLAKIDGGDQLDLEKGINPAWISRMQVLQDLVVGPILGSDKKTLTEEEWISLNAAFAPYETWLGSKSGVSVEQLGIDRVREILKSDGREKLEELVARDKALEPEFTAISDVDRLVHYYRDLRALLHNFVNFADFYSDDHLAVFQSGTLFFDSRSTELCMVVSGPSPLAAKSRMYIVYMDCTRKKETMKIAACITQGDSDYLFVGRNGVFYDRKGRDWDATVTSIVDNPISIRQAFFSPYKKFVRMIEEQVEKRAAAADAASSEKLQKAAEATASADASAAPSGLLDTPSRKIDVGTVAALGVAVGAIGGALATLATGFARLALWQIPLVVMGVILLISLPSMVIAAIKLRQRTLGPLLEANGWAINGRVRISIPFGRKLTRISKLPPGSKRSFLDPYQDRSRFRNRLLILLVLLFAVGALAIYQDRSRRGHYFWETDSKITDDSEGPGNLPVEE